MTPSELLMHKREVVSTTNTHGWHLIKQLAEEAVSELERQVFAEDDDARGVILRREAKAARKFLTMFLQSVESMRQVEAPEPDLEQGTLHGEEATWYEVAN